MSVRLGDESYRDDSDDSASAASIDSSQSPGSRLVTPGASDSPRLQSHYDSGRGPVQRGYLWRLLQRWEETIPK